LKKSLITIASFIAFSVSAHADTFTYTFNGGFIDPEHGNMTSTISYSVTSPTLFSGVAVIDASQVTWNTPAPADLIFQSIGFLQDGNDILITEKFTDLTGDARFVEQTAVTGELDQVGIYSGIVGQTLTVSEDSPVPEPSSIALLGTGILSMAGTIRRRFIS
jgi:hypothetical protein